MRSYECPHYAPRVERCQEVSDKASLIHAIAFLLTKNQQGAYSFTAPINKIAAFLPMDIQQYPPFLPLVPYPPRAKLQASDMAHSLELMSSKTLQS